MPVVGVLLAAGQGSRFGGGKLLHPFGPAGEALSLVSWRHLCDAVPDTVVVIREDDHAVRSLFEASGARIALCEDAREGMGRSIACGVRATPDADGWIVALGDMPLLQPATVQSVLARLDAGASIVVPTCGGRRGHPVGFAGKHGPALQRLGGDEGARRILAEHRADVIEVAVEDVGIHADVDTREDAARLIAAASRPR
jgi:molybdenum cofactor cytidylyltransferase